MSVQNLQWVPSGHLLTYGGFMLLGGLASNSGTVIGSRLAQGLGRTSGGGSRPARLRLVRL
jgi:hypothetical protein